MKKKHQIGSKLHKQIKQINWLFGQGHRAEALEKAQSLHALHPNNPRLLATFGYIQGYNKKINEGLDNLAKALSNAPNDPFIRFFYAEILNKNKEYELALTVLEPTKNDKKKLVWL